MPLLHIFSILFSLLFSSCNGAADAGGKLVSDSLLTMDTMAMPLLPKDSGQLSEKPLLPGQPVDSVPRQHVDVGNLDRTSLVQYAKTLYGVPYLYASTDPARGFDCSGFITYVFNHFNTVVPRSSVEFTNVGKEIHESQAKPGDLILFTGTDSTRRVVGHMGIIVDNSDSLRFIHSSSGKANGVTITPLNAYYRSRFVKVIDIIGK